MNHERHYFLLNRKPLTFRDLRSWSVLLPTLHRLVYVGLYLYSLQYEGLLVNILQYAFMLLVAIELRQLFLEMRKAKIFKRDPVSSPEK